MSTRPGSTFEAIAATSDWPAPEPGELGCGVRCGVRPMGAELATGLDPSCHRPWPMPTPAASSNSAPSDKATALPADPPLLTVAERGGAHPRSVGAQAACQDPGFP